MAHRQQRDWLSQVKQEFPELFTDQDVLEVGSLDINGTVRDFFEGGSFLGCDVGLGPGVDLIANGEDLNFPDDEFDVAISAECFEHNPEWQATFANMHRMARTAVIVTCASDGRPEHGTARSSPGSSPLTTGWNYYKNLNEDDFEQAFNLDTMFKFYEFQYNPESQDLYFLGFKR